ncbi:hypothetical protein T484DRAFT_1823801 [Baffinella frigidus]|nr:hypothetical protein T484DRAFT_1823801 [Cryptophyta sp. CCMP2293]
MNLAVLALSLALVYLGASGLLRIDPADNQTGAERPFVFICVVGALLAVSSLAGVAGAMCAISRDGGFRGACCSNRLLLFYYLTILVECALLLYAAILCFVFVNKAAEYLAEYGDSILALAANEGLTLTELEAVLQNNSNSAGAVCLAAMLLHLLCAHCSATVLGYRYTSQRTVLATSLLGGCLGVALLTISALPETQEVGVKHGDLPELLIGTGVAALVFSAVGVAAALTQRPLLLAGNGVAMTLLSALLLVVTVVLLVASRNPADHTGLAQDMSLLVQERFVDVNPQP